MSASPIFCGHAHSDSDRARPLFEALDRGFTQIEADVYFRDGDLLVGHDEENLRPERNLRANYLEPLFASGGRVYSEPAELFLVLDFKEDDPRVYEELKRQIRPYEEMLTSWESGRLTVRAVRLLLSGERPVEAVKQESRRWAFLDGRLWDGPPDAHDPMLYPVVSADLARHFPGDPPEEIRALAERYHAVGQRLRFWGVPEEPRVWRRLFDLGVDLISVDDYAKFTEFLRGADVPPSGPV